jgi:imidazolonepropionase-like amidohydrolase
MKTDEPSAAKPQPNRAKAHKVAQCSSVFLTFLLFFLLVTASPASAATIVLTGATVHTISGETFSPGQVLIKDGKIAALGKTVSATGAETVDLTGKHLYPGMIALNTVLGLTEISGVRATQDTTEVGDYTPDVESWIAVNPDSELIPVTRANGIGYFQPVPQGGIVSGQSGLVAVDGWTTEERTIRKPIALHLFWPSMELDTTPKERAKGNPNFKSIDEQARERRARLLATEDFFEEAKAYAKAKDAAAKGNTPSPDRIPAWEAMLPYVGGQLPIMVHADEIRQINAAVSWASTNHYKIILAGGRDAWMAAESLSSNKIPVIYGHTFTQPVRDVDPYDVHFKAPEMLRKAGVQVAFSFGSDSFTAPLVKNLPYSAAQAVAFGLPEAEALKGLTLYPAQLAGVADRLGSIEVGKEATLFAADGSILDIRAHVERMWLAGKEISLENRHTRLYEKYKHRPRAK